MARIRKRVHYSDCRSELAETKALRQGGFEDAYWDEDELVDHRRSRKKKRQRRGCPGNEGKGHVYVWVTEVVYGSKWNPHFGFWTTDLSKRYVYDHRRCCGCDKVDRSRRRR